MNPKAALAIALIAALGGAILLMTIVNAGKDYAKAQDARAQQMWSYGSGSR